VSLRAARRSLLLSRCTFPATQGRIRRGVPTAYAAFALNEQIRPGSDPPPVWPWKKGTTRGIAFHPLYSSVPEAAVSAREQALALTLLEERLQP